MTPLAPEPTGLQPVADLLIQYLVTSPFARLPGADGILLVDVLASYAALAAAGQVPDEGELCRRHPDLAARLAAYFYLTRPVEGT